ncbi:MAG: SH3 domain-containing protein [Deltaproteobacteria bacterium]|nr:SH3 domain-containing protein [Deltaproteobacteria bacterium]
MKMSSTPCKLLVALGLMVLVAVGCGEQQEPMPPAKPVVVRKKIEVPRPPAVQVVKPGDQEAAEPVTEEKPPVEVAKAEPAQVEAEPPTPEAEVSDVSKPLPSVKADSWCVLLRRMNLRQDSSTASQIISKLDENAEFQIIEEAPDNNPRTSWYLVRTRSGISGWLAGIYNGKVKFKDLAQPDLLQKEIAADLVKTPQPEAEVSDVPEPLPSVKADSWYVLLRRMNLRQDASTTSMIILKLDKNTEFQIIEEAPENNASTSWYLIKTSTGFRGWLCGIFGGNIKFKDLSQPDLLQKEVAADLVKTPQPEAEVADVPEPLPSVKAGSWYVLIRRMNIRQDSSTTSMIIRELNENAEFQIIEEAPNNNPRNSWYLIRTRSGISGWLAGIYAGKVKFKDLSQPDLLQKEVAADLVKSPQPEAEVADVPEPLPSVKAGSWYVLLRRMNIRQDPSTSGKIISKLNENAEFQIIEEAPDNNPSNAWYLIRTRSGISGWLAGIFDGNVKYKELPQSDQLAPR